MIISPVLSWSTICNCDLCRQFSVFQTRPIKAKSTNGQGNDAARPLENKTKTAYFFEAKNGQVNTQHQDCFYFKDTRLLQQDFKNRLASLLFQMKILRISPT